jgi:hypothetical protein
VLPPRQHSVLSSSGLASAGRGRRSAVLAGLRPVTAPGPARKAPRAVRSGRFAGAFPERCSDVLRSAASWRRNRSLTSYIDVRAVTCSTRHATRLGGSSRRGYGGAGRVPGVVASPADRVLATCR